MYIDNHTISNEQLSAYLDQELSGVELTAVEQALAAQPEVAKRLATLKLVNELAKGQARVIDAEPVPATVLQLLAGAHSTARPDKAPVLKLLAQRVQKLPLRASGSLALAASLVLAVGLSFILFTESRQGISDQSTLAAYTDILDTVASGSTITTDSFALTPRFTFVSRENTVCRLYQLETAASSTDNIACREGEDWTLHTTAVTSAQDVDAYLPASNTGEALDTVLDNLMLDAPLTLEQETALMNQNWQAF